MQLFHHCTKTRCKFKVVSSGFLETAKRIAQFSNLHGTACFYNNFGFGSTAGTAIGFDCLDDVHSTICHNNTLSHGINGHKTTHSKTSPKTTYERVNAIWRLSAIVTYVSAVKPSAIQKRSGERWDKYRVLENSRCDDCGDEELLRFKIRTFEPVRLGTIPGIHCY